ncbi:MAG: YjgN family protein [Dongiaceae bacterium]
MSELVSTGSFGARRVKSQSVQKLEYDGSLGALYWIFIKNLLLNIITLTIYRFWGKTNLRRYAWSHTTLQGHRFEYTGRGGELFIGFLIVVGIYVVGFLALSVATLALGPAVQVFSQLGFVILVLYLIFVAQYAAQNYRLTRTQWCGIRGGMTGSAWTYGVKGFLFSILNLVTLNLAAPWTTLRLAEDRFNNSYFGNAKASLQTSAGPLYLPYILGFVGMILGIVIWAGAIWAVLMGSGALEQIAPFLKEMADAERARRRPDLTEEQIRAYVGFLVTVGIAGYLGIVIVGIAAFAPYVAAMFRAIANNLQLAELRFSSEVTASSYIGLWIGNLLWVVLTLGLGFPVAVHRSLKFFADRVAIHGELDVERLRQTSLDRPKFGEGLLEAFDPGFF